MTARVNPETLSGNDDITLDLLYGAVQMHKTMLATVDGDNPVVAIIAPANGAYLRGTSYVVGGSTTDPTTWITERSLSIVPQGRPPTSRPSSRPGPLGLHLGAADADGLYTLQARATDAMEHSTTSGGERHGGQHPAHRHPELADGSVAPSS